jgi:hypothetical protein
MKKIILATAFSLALTLAAASAARASDGPPKAWQDVRALVVRFNDAQNAHNLDVVGALMLNSPDFVWEAGNVVELGHDAAVNKLAQIYQGDWRVLPDYGALSIELVTPTQADVTMPTEFKSAPAGQDVVTTESVVRERAVLTPQGWRLVRIATDPPPAAFLL